MLKGGCYCGAVRYELHAMPYHLTHCHCGICRRVSAAAFVTWLSVPREAFRLVRGELRRFASSSQAHRGFCAGCGTPICFEHRDAAHEVDITLCSLDEPHALTPHDHTFVSSQLSWVHLDDGLPRFPRRRDAGQER